MIQLYPKFDASVRDYEPSLAIFVDKLGEAIATNFKQYMEFAQPASFWQRYKKSFTPKKRKSRKRSGSICSQQSDLDSLMTDDTEDDRASIMTEDD